MLLNTMNIAYTIRGCQNTHKQDMPPTTARAWPVIKEGSHIEGVVIRLGYFLCGGIGEIISVYRFL